MNMAFIHPQSCECTKSELDYFVVPPTQTSKESGNYVEYNPIATISQGTPIECSTTGAGQDYLDLLSTQLYVKAQIIKAHNDAIDNNDHVEPTNLFLHSVFSEVDITLNDTLVTSSPTTLRAYAYTEVTWKLISVTVMLRKLRNLLRRCITRMLLVIWKIINANPNDDVAQNTGFKKRIAR